MPVVRNSRKSQPNPIPKPKIKLKPWERVALYLIYGLTLWATFECAKMLYDMRYHQRYLVADPFKAQNK